LNGKARIRWENVEGFASLTQDMKRQMRKSAHCDTLARIFCDKMSQFSDQLPWIDSEKGKSPRISRI